MSLRRSGDPLLEVRELSTTFFTHRGTVPAVRDVSLTVRRAEIVSLVGESGSGKSLTAYSILRLMPSPTARIVGGQVTFDGMELTSLKAPAMRNVRGSGIGLVLQDPRSSLNPVFTVRQHLRLALRREERRSRREVQRRTLELLEEVEIRDPGRVARAYPHELSGGMRQRVAIALALAAGPKLLITDECTSALDPTTQQDIVLLLLRLRRSRSLSVLFITHDLPLAAEISDCIAVMYAGQLVEFGTSAQVIERPQHPYTRALFQATPSMKSRDIESLSAIVSHPPSPDRLPSGCAFHPRCPSALARCSSDEPPLIGDPAGECARCWLVDSSASC